MRRAVAARRRLRAAAVKYMRRRCRARESTRAKHAESQLLATVLLLAGTGGQPKVKVPHTRAHSFKPDTARLSDTNNKYASNLQAAAHSRALSLLYDASVRGCKAQSATHARQHARTHSRPMRVARVLAWLRCWRTTAIQYSSIASSAHNVSTPPPHTRTHIHQHY